MKKLIILFLIWAIASPAMAQYVTVSTAGVVNVKSGGDFQINGVSIVGVATGATDTAARAGVLDMSNRIDAVTGALASVQSGYLPLAGGTMTGDLEMNNAQIKSSNQMFLESANDMYQTNKGALTVLATDAIRITAEAEMELGASDSVGVLTNLLVRGDIVPAFSNFYSLGSAERPWRSIFVSNEAAVGAARLQARGSNLRVTSTNDESALTIVEAKIDPTNFIAGRIYAAGDGSLLTNIVGSGVDNSAQINAVSNNTDSLILVNSNYITSVLNKENAHSNYTDEIFGDLVRISSNGAASATVITQINAATAANVTFDGGVMNITADQTGGGGGGGGAFTENATMGILPSSNHHGNTQSGIGSFVVGSNNTVSADYVTAGGRDLNVSGKFGVALGKGHTLSGLESAIIGGDSSSVAGDDSAIAGGNVNNIASGANFSFIGGGESHDIVANRDHSAIIGGNNATVQGDYSIVLGGQDNVTKLNEVHMTTLGGVGTRAQESYTLVWAGAGGATNYAAESALFNGVLMGLNSTNNSSWIGLRTVSNTFTYIEDQNGDGTLEFKQGADVQGLDHP